MSSHFSKCSLLILWQLMLPFSIVIYGQSYNGITFVKDTSFTISSAFIKAKQHFPNCQLVGNKKNDLIVQKNNVTYCSYPNRKLKLDLFYKRKGLKKNTAIIILHGGGWRSGNKEQQHSMAQQLASLGYVCFVPEYRLSTEALFPAAIYDIKAAIRWVRQNASQYHVDPNQIVCLGFSAGGELAAFMGTTGNMPIFEGISSTNKISSAVNAVIDIDGTLSFVHPESGEGDDTKNTSAATYWLGYSKKDNPLLWQAASPLGYVSSATPPTAFINSSIPRMHAGRADYISVLNTYGIYYEVHEFENSPHTFCFFEPWFDPMIQHIDHFLAKIFG